MKLNSEFENEQRNQQSHQCHDLPPRCREEKMKLDLKRACLLMACRIYQMEWDQCIMTVDSLLLSRHNLSKIDLTRPQNKGMSSVAY